MSEPIHREGTYVYYGNPLSYFTRKLDAAMDWYGAPRELRHKTVAVQPEIESRSGTHQIPVLLTPENWCIADTTPILDLVLDTRFPDRRLFPAGPLGVLVHVLEEWLDEWVPRTVVHYRWQYDESAAWAAPIMVEANAPELDAESRAPLEQMIAGWGVRACRATGVGGERQQREAEAEYRRILEALEAQLGETRFALGDRPTAVDAVLLGGLRAHTYADPVPRRVVEQFPRVVAWVDGAREWDGAGELAPFPESTPFARALVAEAAGAYRSFVLGNAAALAGSDRAFTATVFGEEVSYLKRPYPERSRRMVHERIAHRLEAADRDRVLGWLRAVGLADVFAP